MKVFAGVQRLTTLGTRFKVSVPCAKSIIVSNKTDGVALLYPDQSSKVPFPLFSGEDLDVEILPVAGEFYVNLLAEDLEEYEGFYILSQNDLSQPVEAPEKKITNTVIINK